MMTVSNIYLVQALRGYREKSYGQFDQVTEHLVPLTQDAAAEIERLNALVTSLERREIAIGVGRPIVSGNYQRWGWKEIAEILDKEDGSVSFYTLVVGDEGIEAYGSILPNGGRK